MSAGSTACRAPGELHDPSGAAPDSRATYSAAWFDDLGRTVKSVNYGTNGGNALADQGDDFNPGVGGVQDYEDCAEGMDPNTAASDYCIITKTAYDGFGRPYLVENNAGQETKTIFDDAGRRQYVVENYKDFDPDTRSTISDGDANDQDRVTKFTYNELGVLKEQTALDANTAKNQTTRYVYAFELGDKGCPIHRPELLRGIIFPDSDANVSGGIGAGTFSNTDHVTYTYYCVCAR